jgi:hypothetical protein
VVPNERPGEFRRSLLAPRKQIIDEGGVWADENVIFNREAVPQLDATFDRDSISQRDIVFDEDVIADVGVGANDGAWEDVSESPHAAPRPNRWRLD